MDNIESKDSLDSKDGAVTTTFADDGVTNEKSYTTSVTKDRLVVEDQGLASFFAKPAVIKQALWSTATAQGGNLHFFSPYTAMTAVVPWTDKLRGYALLRGTAVIRVQINANPFQQGKLLISWMPLLTALDSVGTTTYMQYLNLESKRMKPCVELDCSETSAILRIPYISPTSWIDVRTGDYSWGRISIDVLSPLVVGAAGTTTVEYSVFLHFEDVEFAAPLYPQMNSKIKPKKFSGRSLNREEAKMETGPISAALALTSKVAGGLGAIPMLTPVMEPLSWVANAASGVAGAFGWAKPDNHGAATLMSQQYNPNMASADGLDMCYKLGLNEDHGVTLSNGDTIRDSDETSWAFLRTVETIVGVTTSSLAANYLPVGVTWAATDAAGTTLLSEYIGPQSGTYTQRLKTDGLKVATYQIGPPIYYFSHMFNFWRGSICVKLKFVKTQFHTGRLMIIWTPGRGVLTTPSIADSTYSIRQILDVRDGNETCIQLPWLLPYNYVEVGQTYGKLDVIVLNPLRAPETVSQSVQILKYVSGGDDFEFAVPGYNGADPGNIAPGVFTPEMNTGGSDEVIKEEVIGGAKEASYSSKEMEESIGEAFLSVKQLLNRYTPWYALAKTQATVMQFYPWYSSAVSQTIAGLTVPETGGDAFNWISPMYLFYRGNARVSVTTHQPTALTNGTEWSPSNIIVTGTWYTGPVTGDPQGPSTILGVSESGSYNYILDSPLSGNGIVVASAGTGVTSWQVPYSTRYKTSLNTTMRTSVITSDVTRARGALVLSSHALSTDYVAYRSFDDNFHLSFFLGCPPVVVNAV